MCILSLFLRSLGKKKHKVNKLNWIEGLKARSKIVYISMYYSWLLCSDQESTQCSNTLDKGIACKSHYILHKQLNW